MSSCCLSCARRGGKQPGCALCASIAPTPRHQVVRNIIERVAHEHRLSKFASDERFRADLGKVRDKHAELLDTQRKCRRRKRHEQMIKDLEAS